VVDVSGPALSPQRLTTSTMHALMLLLHVALFVLSLPAALACTYLLVQTAMSGALPPAARSSRRTRFDIIVPAHNEAAVIANTIANLRQLDWPPDRYRLLVVADNCTDATAAIASAAGAVVLERQDAVLRGKGYALLFAFERSLEDGWADAVAVVDADAEVSRNLLEAFASRLDQGAHAVQAHYGVLNPWGSWRTRLLTIAMAAYHVVRSRARARQRVSCGIRGNGWCVTQQLLKSTSYNAFSLAEDIEYGIALGLAGYRVHYAGEADASQEMTADPQIARKQRQRWEHGRFQLIRSCTLPLLGAAVRRRSGVCLDLALDLVVLPFTYVALTVCSLLVLSLLATWWSNAFIDWLWFSVACSAVLVLYVLRGWSLSGTGLRGLVDLVGAPVFVVWKVILMLSRHQSGEWVRTDRKPS
jgi:cellulose synthase/poly-beta-1,6-N-acetylglucosamine synthase-like glycosyltransferase